MSGFDDFDIIGFSILVVTLVIYATLFLVQTCYLNSEIYRIQVLSMRFAFFVIPAYTILFYVSVTASDTIFGMELIVAVLEAFAFWNLFAMIVSNLGGPVGMLKTINFLDTLPNHHLIRCMCLNGPQLYMRFVWALRLFSTVRVLLVFLFCVFSYTGDRQAAGLSNAASAVFVVYAFTNFLALYHRIASASDSIYAGTKFLIFKIVVLLVVLESLVNRFLPEGDKINLDPSGDSEGDERDLSLLFMIEFAVLLPLYIYAFGSKMTASANTQAQLRGSISYVDPEERPAEDFRKNCCTFLLDILMLHNTFYELIPTREELEMCTRSGKNSKLNEPISPVSVSNPLSYPVASQTEDQSV